jgi:uncharacterized protein (TIGR00251 family)
MNTPHNFIEKHSEDNFVLYVKVFPKSGFNRVNGIYEDENGNKFLKLQVTEVAEDGKANKAVIKLLSNHLDVSKSSFEIIYGASGSKKQIIVKTHKNIITKHLL